MQLIFKIAFLLVLSVSAQWDDMDFEFADADASEDEVIRPGDSNYDFDLFEDGSSGQSQDLLTLIMADANECAMNIVYKYDIHDEIKAFFQTMGTGSFIEVMDKGTHEEIREYLAAMINSLTLKVLGMEGS